MAAEQAVGPRCEACGVDISSRRKQCKYCVGCAADRHAHLKAMRQRAEREALRMRKRRSVAPNEHRVISQFELKLRPPVKLCEACGGMTWARSVERKYEYRGVEIPVAVIPPYTGEVTPLPVCRGCGWQWAPEPAPERGSVIRSSGGLAVSSGMQESNGTGSRKR